MMKVTFGALIFLLAACSNTAIRPTPPSPSPSPSPSPATLAAAETAFAKSMQDRNFAAFSSFIDDAAVFINGGKPLRGKAEILAHWQQYFEQSAAPFAWRPELVELSSGNELGYTEGPVFSPDAAVTAKFYSTWKLQPDGTWRIVFDNGYPLCETKK